MLFTTANPAYGSAVHPLLFLLSFVPPVPLAQLYQLLKSLLWAPLQTKPTLIQIQMRGTHKPSNEGPELV